MTVYRDIPNNAGTFLKHVMLPVEKFNDIMALAYVGETVMNMEDGWVLFVTDGVWHCSSSDSPVVFRADNPMKAIDDFREWLEQHGEVGND